MFRLINELLGPEDNSGGGATPIEDKALTAAELESILAEDDKEDEPEVIDLAEPKKDKNEKKGEKEEDKEDKDDDEDADGDTEDEDEDEKSLEDEIEEDLAEPEDEELEALVTPVRRREILAKYPNIFKDFPYLQSAYYREQKYTEIYPTIKEAEEAADKAKTWDRFEGELTDGNLSNILKVVKDSDPNTFHKIADTILDTIKEVDAPTATHIYSGIAKNIIELMVDASNQPGQEPLKTAAHLVYQFLFGQQQYEPHRPLHKAQQKDNRTDEISQRERAFVEKQFTIARDEVGNKINNSIKATIERNIDPKNTMTAYVKTKAVDDVLKDVQEQMKGDKRFQKILTQLWQRAVSKDFNDDSKADIRRAVMAKAKQLLLPAISKGRKTALGTATRKPVDSKDEVTRPEKKGPTKTGNTTSPMNRGKTHSDRAKSIPAGMSTKDFLMSD